jgi:hypothetical protein
MVDPPRLHPLLKGLEKLQDKGLMVANVVAAFHKQRVLPLVLWPLFMYQMGPATSLEGTRMSTEALSVAEVTRCVTYTLASMLAENFRVYPMRP